MLRPEMSVICDQPMENVFLGKNWSFNHFGYFSGVVLVVGVSFEEVLL